MNRDPPHSKQHSKLGEGRIIYRCMHFALKCIYIICNSFIFRIFYIEIHKRGDIGTPSSVSKKNRNCLQSGHSTNEVRHIQFTVNNNNNY